jgi:2-oxoglutarate ferredoxin oxidoreductase subunit gamma
MRHDLFIAGFGGQGVLLAGNLISMASVIEDKNVSFFPAYGVEKRGGAAMCTIVISDGEVGSPVVGNPSVSIILNQASLERYGAKVKPGGTLIVNSTLVDMSLLGRTDIEIIPLPMNGLAMGLGDPRMVNMIAAGAYAARTGAVGMGSLVAALAKVLPERNHRFIPANEKALLAGAAGVKRP